MIGYGVKQRHANYFMGQYSPPLEASNYHRNLAYLFHRSTELKAGSKAVCSRKSYVSFYVEARIPEICAFNNIGGD